MSHTTRIITLALSLVALCSLVAVSGCEAKLSRDESGKVKVEVKQKKKPADEVVNEGIDKLELWAAELPQMKGDILKKTHEFRADLVKAGKDNKRLRGLEERVSKYVAEIEKLRSGGGTAGGKLGGAASAGGGGMGGK